jgi:hypothetical protein
VRRFIASGPTVSAELAVVEEAPTSFLAEAGRGGRLWMAMRPLGDDPSMQAPDIPESGGRLGDVQQPDGFRGVVGYACHCKPC